uniref:Uncharacterized protein n=1 Tax=Pseudictyota dubia TaxID=2749911 RepID=A0A7R9W670_9STRA|mmetsp:Transcript_35349/g.64964  ORF Transcript_35349/g.64964 Transcript_35349/m.64964 type:complete len:306 (+) Transcript_35349:36-953(+)
MNHIAKLDAMNHQAKYSPKRHSSDRTLSSCFSDSDRSLVSSPSWRLNESSAHRRSGSSSVNRSSVQRRTGRVWSLRSKYSDVGDLVQVSHDASAADVRSCMKVATLEDSLRSCNDCGDPFPKTTDGDFAVEERTRRIVVQSLRHGSPRTKAGQKRSVRFGSLRIRECDVIAVDNPEVSRGVAIGLSWSHRDLPTVADVRKYDRLRGPYHRRLPKELKLTEAQRQMKLVMSGVTLEEVEEMEASIAEAKRRRKKTLDSIDCIDADAKLESLMKKVKIALRLRKRHNETEQDLWDKAQNVSCRSIAA